MTQATGYPVQTHYSANIRNKNRIRPYIFYMSTERDNPFQPLLRHPCLTA